MKRSRSPKLISRACLFAAAALLSVGAPPSARAANIFFDQNGATAGTGATGAASFNGAFWVNAGAGTTIPGTAAAAAYTFTNADVAYFIGGTVQTITLASATTLNGINDQTGMTFTGSTFTLAGTTPTINVLTAKTTTISSVLAGTAGLTKAGAGTLVLSGTNTYTGGTFMTAGKLSVGADANLGATAGGLTFNGGTLLSSGTFSSARGVTMTGAGTIEVASAQTLTMTGAFSGTGALTKTGAGTLLFNTTGKAYTGNTTVSAGALTLGVGGSTGAIRGTVTVASGAQLLSTAVDASGYGSGAKLNVINLTGNGSLAALSHTGAGNFGWGVTYNLTGAIMQSNGGTNNATTNQAFSFGGISTTDVNKVVTLASANESRILGRVILRENNLNNRAIFDVADGAAAVDLRVGAFITQSAAGFGIEKTGAGLMLLEQDNSFTGQTHILGGRLQIASDAKLGTAPTAAT
ncbi:MAG: autotransporter-associated beta strand repeat-containing protein, partial [Opitutaceae bacterium]|nr:autotransporter-associated beta strand repeat-containing protein [Opitutaceae bacterium]